MTTYDNNNKGIVSKNARKEKDTHPDIKGSINVEGVEYWLDGWQKKRNDGGTFYSLSVKRKEQQAPKAAGGGIVDDLNDAIPFGPEMR